MCKVCNSVENHVTFHDFLAFSFATSWGAVTLGMVYALWAAMRGSFYRKYLCLPEDVFHFWAMMLWLVAWQSLGTRDSADKSA